MASLYVAIAGIGVQYIEISRAPNYPAPLIRPNSDLGPHGLLLSNVDDVAVHHNVVLLAELANGKSRLRFLDQNLRPLTKPDSDEEYTLPFSSIFGVAAARFVYDVDDDGNLGTAEDGNEVIVLDADGKPKVDPETGDFERVPDETRAIDELFDLALVTGEFLAGGGDGVWVVDFNGLTDLRDYKFVPETRVPRIVASLKSPEDARSVFLVPERQTAYIKMNGKGLAIVDLSQLVTPLKDRDINLLGTDPPEITDKDNNSKDDRILGYVELPTISNRGDVDLDDDPNRPLAFLSNYNAGVEVYSVCNNCQELILDFGTKENWVDQNQGVEQKNNVYEILNDLKIKLYDATHLNEQAHPWSRYLVHHDPATGKSLPILGAVTDGAARVRVEITGLESEGLIHASLLLRCSEKGGKESVLVSDMVKWEKP